MIHRSPAASARTFSAHSSAGVSTQPGRQCSASRWTTGSPRRSPSRRARVLFPAPPGPTMAIRSIPAGLRALDGEAHRVPPLGPRTVVVAHVGPAEQVAQREPAVRRPLADAAVGDGFLPWAQPQLPLVQLLQLVGGA